MGKNRRYTYISVDELPSSAMSIADYAKNVRQCNTSYIYELYRKGKNDFKIVLFKGFNFVIP